MSEKGVQYLFIYLFIELFAKNKKDHFFYTLGFYTFLKKLKI